ncbi:hypothetical protein PC9H_005072 [Pleurotus ostreatus]|uniref:MHD domain-containing protein n=1 Tax=Pleurotus ostreatus TaxID=5322 RepID=A0A8H6ZYD7_PLEOS|nr:uncharacterized protein PC9H_005072 [Pleurotus ostreatus]KAF7433124.1 hypothetical protein PC9H_005072 [Pleurotus ostreatus]KAJ8698244.1 hypothetical protein PTI98_004977 [Pleurotus ostreatus]
MAIDGLIILDSAGRPIIQSGFRSTSPSYALVHIDAYNNAVAAAESKHGSRPGDIDPVIYVPPFNSADSPSACCHVPCGDLRILCPLSGDVDPLFAFAFVQTFVDILTEYFATVNAVTLKDNFDVVYQLLEETLDSGGHPLTTSPNALRDIVLPPSLLTKLLSVAGANFSHTMNAGSSASGPFASPIPWRRAGVKYASNEIYFDTAEEIKAIVGKNGTPLSCNVWGVAQANSRLSGTPDCLLTFTNAHVLADCSFHPCVRLQRWARDKSLSFVPPDGNFTLFEYRYAPAASSTGTSLVASQGGKDNVPLPIALKHSFDITDTSCTFEVSVTSRLTTRDIDGFVAELYVGDSATAIKCVVGRGSAGMSRGLATETGSGGSSWTFDAKNKVVRWEIPKMASSSSWYLRGSFNSTSTPPRPAHAIQTHFEIHSYTFSSLKVESLKVTGEQYKPYKGVRGRTSGNIEWRW